MGLHNDERKACFYVYATYTRPYEREEVNSDQNSSLDKAVVVDDNNHFRELLDKFHDLATENLRDSYPVSHNQRMIDTLCLIPAAIIPNASFSEVCTHFRTHYARILDSERTYEPGYQDAYNEEGLFGPKYEWCMVIDDEALESFDADDNDDTFAELLSGDYVEMKKPVALTAKYRDGTGGIQWNGWFKFSASMLKNVFELVTEGEVESYFRGEDELIDI